MRGAYHDSMSISSLQSNCERRTEIKGSLMERVEIVKRGSIRRDQIRNKLESFRAISSMSFHDEGNEGRVDCCSHSVILSMFA